MVIGYNIIHQTVAYTRSLYLSLDPSGLLQYLEVLGNARLCKGESIDYVTADAPLTLRLVCKDIDNLNAGWMSDALGKVCNDTLAFLLRHGFNAIQICKNPHAGKLFFFHSVTLSQWFHGMDIAGEHQFFAVFAHIPGLDNVIAVVLAADGNIRKSCLFQDLTHLPG